MRDDFWEIWFSFCSGLCAVGANNWGGRKPSDRTGSIVQRNVQSNQSICWKLTITFPKYKTGRVLIKQFICRSTIIHIAAAAAAFDSLNIHTITRCVYDRYFLLRLSLSLALVLLQYGRLWRFIVFVCWLRPVRHALVNLCTVCEILRRGAFLGLICVLHTAMETPTICSDTECVQCMSLCVVCVLRVSFWLSIASWNDIFATIVKCDSFFAAESVHSPGIAPLPSTHLQNMHSKNVTTQSVDLYRAFSNTIVLWHNVSMCFFSAAVRVSNHSNSAAENRSNVCSPFGQRIAAKMEQYERQTSNNMIYGIRQVSARNAWEKRCCNPLMMFVNDFNWSWKPTFSQMLAIKAQSVWFYALVWANLV